jgi:hypothetical protein
VFGLDELLKTDDTMVKELFPFWPLGLSIAEACDDGSSVGGADLCKRCIQGKGSKAGPRLVFEWEPERDRRSTQCRGMRNGESSSEDVQGYRKWRRGNTRNSKSFSIQRLIRRGYLLVVKTTKVEESR